MNIVKKVYGCNSKNDEIRMQSSSGGIFSILAERVLESGGVVYGVAMSEDCKEAIFKRIDSKNDLHTLRGSKYLQSKPGNTYRYVKADLMQGTQVLFSGCPCQINGLKLFLGHEYDNLICVDIICHGVPSPKLWKKYAEYLENKHDASIEYVNFRCKRKKWQEFGLMLSLQKEAEFSTLKDNPYLKFFLKNYSLRPSCYMCLSKDYRRADITIGDFWGVKDILPELNDEKGTSLVILRTTKGVNLFNAIKKEIMYKACDYERAVEKNTAEYKSVIKPKQRKNFFKYMNKASFEDVEKKYLRITIKNRLKVLVKKLIVFFRGGGK